MRVQVPSIAARASHARQRRRPVSRRRRRPTAHTPAPRCARPAGDAVVLVPSCLRRTWPVRRSSEPPAAGCNRWSQRPAMGIDRRRSIPPDIPLPPLVGRTYNYWREEVVVAGGGWRASPRSRRFVQVILRPVEERKNIRGLNQCMNAGWMDGAECESMHAPRGPPWPATHGLGWPRYAGDCRVREFWNGYKIIIV